MNLSEIVKNVMKELGISGKELATRSNQSPQNLSKKLNKGTLSYEEFTELMQLMGAQVSLTYSLPGQEVDATPVDKHTIDQLNILEKQLEVERLKNKYFADMSYEFRTALSIVDGGIKLALGHNREQKKVAEYLNKITPSLQRLTRLVEDNPFNREAGMYSGGQDYLITKALAGKQVLLVDDNELNREIVRELLEDSRILVSEASDGKEAVAMIGEQSYDFVLMDLQMPVMDGFEACRQIRKLTNQKRANTLVFAMTASVTDEDRQKARDSGMDGFIEKPLEIRKLGQILMK